MKKFLGTITSLVLSICLFTSIGVYANDNNSNTSISESIQIMNEITSSSAITIDNLDLEAGKTIDELIQEEKIQELEEENEILLNKNIKETYKNEKEKFNDIKINNKLNNINTRIENTDPNNAYIINMGEITNGVITANGQQRWYGTEINEKSKITAALAMTDVADLDLYIFKLDASTMTLNAVAAGNSGGIGVTEYIDYIADSGIYYFMINSYSGIGNYSVVAYSATRNIANEPNDSMATAKIVSSDKFTITDAIDNPFDIDFFKATYSDDKIVNVSFTKPANSDYVLYATQNGTNIYKVSSPSTINLNSGTWYYYVVSPSGSFNQNSTYTLNITTTSYLSSARILMYTPSFDMIFQCDDSRSSYYINGNVINFSYSYENHISNSYGTADTYMDIYEQANQNVALFESEVNQMTTAGFRDAELPKFVSYTTNWDGAYSKSKALLLTIFNTDITINRRATGAYANTSYKLDAFPCVKVVVDVDTGEIFDITYPNVYYIVGNQRHSISYKKAEYNYTTKQ